MSVVGDCMFNVLLLYFALYVFLFIAWMDSEKDLLSPSVLFFASFIIGVTFYMLGYNRLAEEAFSFETIALILGGSAIFLIVGRVSRSATKAIYKLKKNNGYRCLNYTPNRCFHISRYVYICFIALVTITTVVQIMHVRNQLGGGAVIAVLQQFRNTMNSGGNETLSSSGFVNLFSRVINALQPCFIFVLFYNRIVSRVKFSRPILMWSGIIYCTVCVFLMSLSRATIFTIAFEAMCAMVICINIRNSNKGVGRTSKGNKMWIRIAFFVLLIGIPGFYFGGVFAGKSYSQIKAIQSVENYFSYGLVRLNHIVNHGFSQSEYFGQWSFSGVYALLNRLGGNYRDYNIFPFYQHYGNTITIFGRWYVDFGTLGVLIMAAIVSAFVWYVYTRMKYEKRGKKSLFYSVLYVFIVSSVLMVVYDDWFRNVITINFAFRLIVVILTSRWLYSRLKPMP